MLYIHGTYAVHTVHTLYIHVQDVHVQDTVLVVPPYPYCIEEDRIDVPLEDCWYARPQLFFTCHLRPKHGRLPKNPSYRTGPDDLLFNLVFFSTFEELKLPIRGPMEDAGVVKLYEPSPTPCLYVAPAENMVGRVPLIPLFLAGNKTPTIPHVFSKRKDSGFPMGCADAAALDGRRGSNVYEVNPWLWQFGRGKPRLGGLTVAETADRQLAKVVDRKKRAAETRLRRKADRA
jgi:hypothetical protein